jgi:hypothetical protein
LPSPRLGEQPGHRQAGIAAIGRVASEYFYPFCGAEKADDGLLALSALRGGTL